jgi:hypothetical protein
VRPPGTRFYVAVAFAVLVGVWVSSIQDFGGALLTALIWGLLAVAWGLRLLGALVTSRAHLTVAEWARWLGVPLVLSVVFAWVQSGGPFELRLALSRAAMDQAAAEIIAGASTNRGWIGLWPVEDLERLPGGIRFIVSGCGFIDRCGFAYSTSGSIADLADPAGENRYEHLEGNWFMWIESF